MLAYVFSHRPHTSTGTEMYEAALRRFHGALARGGLRGFVASRSYRIGPGYADWYVVQDSAALDVLNEAAVSGDRAGSHDVVAGLAADGVGRLLTLAEGEVDLDATYEFRFAKPPGMTYAHLYAKLRPWTSQANVGLWRRMMVLGPPPEFSLLCRSKTDLPADIRPDLVELLPM